jgi:hypothetical protein
MEKDIKELLEWLADKNGDVASIWGMSDVITEPNTKKNENGFSDAETLHKIFTDEQLSFIRILVSNVIKAFEFHNNDSLAEAHPEIKEELEKIDAKLRNHRHDTTKQFSAKPEF